MADQTVALMAEQLDDCSALRSVGAMVDCSVVVSDGQLAAVLVATKAASSAVYLVDYSAVKSDWLVPMTAVDSAAMLAVEKVAKLVAHSVDQWDSNNKIENYIRMRPE